MSSNKPTVQALDECLKDVVKNWKCFALHLPGINQTDLEIIEVNKPGDVVAKKLELYKVWLKLYPNASWDDVIKALETAREDTIAKQLRVKCFTKEVQVVSPSSPAPPVPISPVVSQISTTEEVTVREEVVTELNTLHRSFLGLVHSVESGVEDKVNTGELTVKSVTRHLKQERAFPISSLDSVTTSDELFKAIHPHYNFLNCYLIVSIALRFLSREIAENVTKYDEKVESFMKTTKIRSLQNTLKRYSKMFCEHLQNTAIVEIVVENGWRTQSLWLVRNLVETLFPIKHPDELPWYDIVPGSVVMTFIALQHMTPSLIESSRKQTEFMGLIGVISLKIGGALVWEKVGRENNTPSCFEDSLIQATLANNIETVQFLLQHTLVDVNIKNTTNTLINDIDAVIFCSQERAEAFLKTNHTIFTALLKDVEYELQYVHVQMTADDDDSKSSSPVADEESTSSMHCPRDNFLNGRVLFGLSDQLSKPLSTRVKQYRSNVDRITKRKSLLIHLSSSLEKYFPTPFPNSIKVILTLDSAWRTCSVWYVEQLGQLIFTPTLFHKLQWFRVGTSEKSLRVVFLVDNKLTDSLTKECQRHSNNESSLTRLLGIISIQVDDTVVISVDYSNGYTFIEAIAQAKTMGNDEIIELLLQIQQSPVDFIRSREPDINNNHQFIPEPDSTPLMIACCNDNSQLVQLLLDHNADPNIQTRNSYTALMFSAGNNKIFRMLLDHGADIKTCSFLNKTVLYYACWVGNVEVVKTILATNRDLVSIPANNGNTPLNQSCRYGHGEIVGMLLQAEANPNIQDNEGWTALASAGSEGHTEVVGMLLQAKANPNIRTNEGSTALQLASHCGHTEIVEMLLQAKADPNIEDNEGQTALTLASSEGHIEIVEILLQAKANAD